MILWGKISHFSVFMVLQLLASYGKSGLLELEDHEESALVYLKDGYVEAVSVPRSDHLLGARLVKAGLISQTDLRKIILSRTMGRQREFIGITLMNSSKIDKQLIADAITEQAYDNTLELSNWVEGTFKFDDPETAIEFPLSPHINVQHLLLETSRRLDEGLRPSRVKSELAGSELCAYCSSECSRGQRQKYLKDGICLWRNMPVVVREAIFSPVDEPVFSEDEEHEVKGLPFL